jgi:DNA-binding response OmpR family regulator
MHVSKPDADGVLSNPRVLLIEDDEAVAQAMVRGIERSGMSVVCAPTGARGMALRATFKPDVVLVDLELPDTNGVDLISWFAEQQTCGVIVVSGMGEEADRIVGLELGADDYIVKPPRMREMIARIRAVHRRVNKREETKLSPKPRETLVVGPIRINLLHRTVTSDDGKRLQLTSAEFTLLEVLAAANGQAVSRDALSEAALRRPWRPEDRSVDQLVFSLRQKLPPDEGGGPLIHSIRGAGYLLRAPDAA